MKQFTKILIANRGEIAVRIIRTARKTGIRTVAIYTEEDRMSLHVSLADEAVFLKGTSLDETYLNQQLLIRIAVEKKAEAIHPGYGFLAENASFAEAVAKAELVFIGPTPGQIRLLGEKTTAIELARSLNVPVLKSVRGSKNELHEKAKEIGFPLMIKASSGGGGKGMFIVSSEEKLQAALNKAERQSIDYFNNGELFIEKYIPNARHIEVQLLGDHHGNLIHLYERECSIQRHFQKIVEEAPSAFADDDLRAQLCSAALKIGQSVGYRGLGTVEFLVDENGDFRFLEMNTRIQVEHPVTEAVTGIDLVEQQLSIAAGNPLQIKQSDVLLNGHAIEARICAEDAENDFRPSTGTVEKLWFSNLAGVRTDTFIQEQTKISPFYDSLLAKQIAHALNREQAIDLLWHSLSETAVSGLKTNIPLLLQLLTDSLFRKNEISTSFLNNFSFQHLENSVSVAAAYLFFHFFRNKKQAENCWQHIGFWRQIMQFTVWIDGQETELCIFRHQKGIDIYFQDKKYSFEDAEWDDQKLLLKNNGLPVVFFVQEEQSETQILLSGKTYSVRSNFVHKQVRLGKKEKEQQKHFQQKITSDLFGKVLSLEVAPGNQIEEGAVLLTIESMKTEFHILCPQTSIVKKVHVGTGEMIKDGQLLVELEEMTRHSEQSQFTVIDSESLTQSEALTKT